MNQRKDARTLLTERELKTNSRIGLGIRRCKFDCVLKNHHGRRLISAIGHTDTTRFRPSLRVRSDDIVKIFVTDNDVKLISNPLRYVYCRRDVSVRKIFKYARDILVDDRNEKLTILFFYVSKAYSFFQYS